MNARDLLRAALDVGPFRTAYRVAWEVDRRSGFKRLRQPTAHVPMPSDVPSWDEWWSGPAGDSWLNDLPISPPTDETRERGEAARAGRFQLFGAWDVTVGSPPNWHLEPKSGRTWPVSAHWTEALDAEVGDPRIAWELNRFLHVWDWIRLFREDGDPKWARAFEDHIQSWGRQNPFRAGINWASGQELAVRLVSWLGAVATFGPELTSETFRTFVELGYWHGVQIESELGFARHAVPNNHLIAETTALAMLGTFFGGWREADRWRRKGLELLRPAIDAQFHDDGGYCQASHTYHRFALEWLLLAHEMFPEVRDHTSAVFSDSLAYLQSQTVGEGTLPNYGPNDGARLWRGDESAERDFRPLFAHLAARAPVSGVSRESVSHPSAGRHLLRHGDTSVFLRAGPSPRRGGHDDQLHLDVWHDGSWVVTDAGSYSYAGDRHWWFAGADSHNGVMVDGEGQRELAGRFTWVGEATGRVDEWDPGRGRVVASCDAWSDQEVRWEREVTLGEETLSVLDRLVPTGRGLHEHEFRLHWLVDSEPDEVRVREGDGWTCATPNADITIAVRPVLGRLQKVEREVVASELSWYYGTLQPATSLICLATARGVEFETRFVFR